MAGFKASRAEAERLGLVSYLRSSKEHLARVLQELGRHEEARMAMEEALREVTSDTPACELGGCGPTLGGQRCSPSTLTATWMRLW